MSAIDHLVEGELTEMRNLEGFRHDDGVAVAERVEASVLEQLSRNQLVALIREQGWDEDLERLAYERAWALLDDEGDTGRVYAPTVRWSPLRKQRSRGYWDDVRRRCEGVRCSLTPWERAARPPRSYRL
jgi:hypothetical protein